MKKYTIELKWALIFVGMGLVWMALERAFGLHDTHIDKHATYTNLVAIPSIIIYFLALRDKRKNYYNGQMTYLQGFLSGVVISLIVTVLTPLSQYITSTIITPQYFPNVIEYAVKEGKMTLTEAQEYFTLSNYIVQSMIFAPVAGIFTSAIVAIFTFTRKPKAKQF